MAFAPAVFSCRFHLYLLASKTNHGYFLWHRLHVVDSRIENSGVYIDSVYSKFFSFPFISSTKEREDRSASADNFLADDFRLESLVDSTPWTNWCKLGNSHRRDCAGNIIFIGMAE